MTHADPHRNQPILTAGVPLSDAQAALILLHGRGTSADSIMQLAEPLAHDQYAHLAPQAAGYTWYPHRFIAPLTANEPFLSSALAAVERTLQQVLDAGIPAERVVIGGFSQGACLASEFVVRNPRRYGGVLVFSGGLIGEPGTTWNSDGSLSGTPVLVGCSDSDPHVPLTRIHETTQALQHIGAQVTERIYPGMGHIIIPDEIDFAQQIMQRAAAGSQS